MRVFMAIPIPPEVKARLVALQQEFRQLAVEATWVREAGFHLTVKFLGEVDPKQIEPIVSCMRDTSHQCQPFSLTVSGVGVFPHGSRPRVLWVGIQDGTSQLAQLQHTLETRLAPSGFRPEGRAFAPHLTLARLKRIQRWEDFMACVTRHREDTFGHLEVDHLELVESQLHPSGARYSTITAVHFPSMAGQHGV